MKWVLYKRKTSQGEENFGIDVHQKNKPVRTIAPSKTIKGLAEMVFDQKEFVKFSGNDTLTTAKAPIFTPNNNYIDIPVITEEIIEFVEKYKRL